MSKKLLVIALTAAVGGFAMYAGGCAAVTDQRAIVGGEVVADGLVQQGALVRQGDVLVKVKSLAGGSAAAARATTAGKVTQVFVRPGDKVRPQQVVAKISE